MFKPCTTKTSIVNRSFDEMGNLLWQQEAAEFVEQYPQRRRPQAAALLLRQSASAGTLYRKPETVMPIINKRASGGELLTPQHRHQRDLFSGDLGIPDVNSHVGTMVHNFENMALQRRLAERQREQKEREHSKYLAELMAMQATAVETQAPQASATNAGASFVATTTTTTKRTYIPSTATHCSNSKMQQLKKKTHETRQKIIQQILQNHPMHKDVTKIQGTPRHLKGARQASTNSEVYYRNIDEDYRKNLFNTLTNRKLNSENLQQVLEGNNSDIETSSFCDEIVAQAFDEIFEGYSGLEEDEEEIVDIKKSQSLMPDFSNTSSFLQQYGRPGLTPKKLPPITVHKKQPAPPPPTTSILRPSSSHAKHKVMPFSENQERSSTIHNLFERLKSNPNKSQILPSKLTKTSSDTLLKNNDNHSPFLHKFPTHLQLNREVEGEESNEKLEQDFLRGSTVSQSFVKHLKVHKPSKGKAPPAPSSQAQSCKKPLKTSEALRQVLLFSKKSRSTGELLPDNCTTIETRKYYRKLDEDFNTRKEQESKMATDFNNAKREEEKTVTNRRMTNNFAKDRKEPEKTQTERKMADGCSGLVYIKNVPQQQQQQQHLRHVVEI